MFFCIPFSTYRRHWGRKYCVFGPTHSPLRCTSNPRSHCQRKAMKGKLPTIHWWSFLKIVDQSLEIQHHLFWLKRNSSAKNVNFNIIYSISFKPVWPVWKLQPPLAQNDTNANKRECTVSYTTVQKFGLKKNNNTSIQQGHVTLMKNDSKDIY